MLTATELTQLRAAAVDLLPDTCRIEYPTTVNTNGYVTETWGTAVASAKCRFDPDKSRKEENIIGEREAMVTRYQVTLEWNTTIADGYRLIYAGGTFQVIELHDNHSLRMVRRCRVAQIRGG